METLSVWSAKQLRRIRRAALFVIRNTDCNPLKYRPEACYNPLDTLCTYVMNRSRYRAVARPYDVIHVDPTTILWNLRVPPRLWPLGTILEGNWDRAFRRPVDIAWKIVSMRQRFHDGMPWSDTDLFQRFYRPQFEHGPGALVKGARSMSELVATYEREYDGLYVKMREQGFRTPTIGEPDITFAYVHIDRAGAFMYTLEGNHRLGMAIALELPSIPVRVATRHHAWQQVREATRRGDVVPSRQSVHPDLCDLHRGRA